jgi:acyl transferase domain-containing protein
VEPNPKLVLLFTADGALQPSIVQELRGSEPIFAEEFDKCAAQLRSAGGADLQAEVGRSFVGTDPGVAAQAAFAVCYALAQVWLRSGVKPQLFAGDRIGECVAACLAGVLSFDDALAVAAWRSSPDKTAPKLPAGNLKAPGTPILSLLKGTPIGDAEATDVEYWSRKVAPEPPKEAGLNALFESPDTVLLEVGTASGLSALVRRRAEAERRIVISSLLEEFAANAAAQLWQCRGRLWLTGVGIDWRKCHREQRYRVPLPTYPFERQKCWIGPPDSGRMIPQSSGTNPVTGQQRHARPALPTAYQAPETDIQTRLVSLWEELLGVESVGVADSFFELGGHSLIAVQLVSRLREIFDVNIEPEAVFETENIIQLATLVEEALVKQIAEMSEEEAEALLNDTPEQ